MRISDWSSDVCSSDLIPANTRGTSSLQIGTRIAVLRPGASGVSAAAVAEIEYLLRLNSSTKKPKTAVKKPAEIHANSTAYSVSQTGSASRREQRWKYG